MKKETLEEAAANLADPNLCKTDNWIAGANWQAKRMYSEEEVHSIVSSYSMHLPLFKIDFTYGQWFEQFKKK